MSAAVARCAHHGHRGGNSALLFASALMRRNGHVG